MNMNSNTYPQVVQTGGSDNQIPSTTWICQIAAKLISFPRSIYEMLKALLLYFTGALYDTLSRVLNQAAFNSVTDDDNSRLFQVWHESDKSSVVFISIELGFSCRAQNSISSIGLSWWCLDESTDIQSHHLEVTEEEMELSEAAQLDNIDTFSYGIAKFIKRSEINMFLSRMFDRLATNRGTICLVGHRIRLSLGRLALHWDIPNNVFLFDTERIWQSQNSESAPVSLEECIKQTSSLAALNIPQDNAGNNAHMTMELLRVQGEYLSRG
ncbi:hypothetical protein F5Y14DRAFT_418338 [Nemania sp. NC0429]|nr:hypothetical protein F5Y14DRAFT_418338 [Nemania sp. NC0429]